MTHELKPDSISARSTNRAFVDGLRSQATPRMGAIRGRQRIARAREKASGSPINNGFACRGGVPPLPARASTLLPARVGLDQHQRSPAACAGSRLRGCDGIAIYLSAETGPAPDTSRRSVKSEIWTQVDGLTGSTSFSPPRPIALSFEMPAFQNSGICEVGDQPPAHGHKQQS